MQETTPRGDRSVSVLVLSMLLLCSSCGSESLLPKREACSSGIGLGPLPCPCISWTNYVEPTCCSCRDCVRLEPNLATVPAQAVLKVGQRFQVGSGHDRTQPMGCNEGNWNNLPTWSSTDPSVLGFELARPADYSLGQFVALAPGVGTVAVEDVLTPSGQPERVRLTACSQESAQGICASRVPLDIVVVP
jgi:hypothetical protein